MPVFCQSQCRLVTEFVGKVIQVEYHVGFWDLQSSWFCRTRLCSRRCHGDNYIGGTCRPSLVSRVPFAVPTIRRVLFPLLCRYIQYCRYILVRSLETAKLGTFYGYYYMHVLAPPKKRVCAWVRCVRALLGVR
jgi:hypothetical protein